MRAALVIAGKDLRQRVRDRTAYVVGIVAPLVIAGLISLAFGRSGMQFSATFAVVDRDGGALAAAFADGVLNDPEFRKAVKVRSVATEEEAERLAADGDVAAAIVIPPGFSAMAAGGPPMRLRVIRSAGTPVGADVAVSVAEGFMAQVNAVRLSVETAVATGSVEDHAALAARAAAMPVPASVAEQSTESSDVSPGSAYAPAMGVFFMFFVVGLGARSLVAERREGTLARLLAAPLRPVSLLAGKAVAAWVLGVGSLAAMAIASSLLFDAAWGDVASAAMLILVTVFAATGITAFVLTLARTEQQANLYASVITMVLALLGGNFVNVESGPQLLRSLSFLTPNGWALQAFRDLAADGGGPGSVLGAVGAIAAFGAVTLALAASRSRRLVTL